MAAVTTPLGAGASPPTLAHQATRAEEDVAAYGPTGGKPVALERPEGTPQRVR